MYKVFLGAPSSADLQNGPVSYHWKIIPSKKSEHPISATQSIVLPPATLEAASRRISLVCQNIIFDDSVDEQEYGDTSGNDDDNARQDQTTLITWPPDVTAPSFLNASKSYQASALYDTMLETQDTQSYNYSDASSIARFPSFHFNLHGLTAISALSNSAVNGSRKITALLAALEVEGPDTIRIKKGADAGKEVTILKMILGDEEGAVCKLTAWREIADVWGGLGDATAIKRGDILFIENVMAKWESTTSPALSASPYLKSKAEICYRTMPYTHEDRRLRPDLRLGDSDPSVRKVAAIVRWFEGMAGFLVT